MSFEIEILLFRFTLEMVETYKKVLKSSLFTLWAILFLSGIVLTILFFHHHSIPEGIEYIQHFAGNHAGKLIAIVFFLFILRAFIFIPITVLGAVAAFCIPHIILAVVVLGISIFVSALLSFGIARFLGRNWVAHHETPRLKYFDEKVKDRGFFTIFILRILMFIPFDLINLGSGFSGIQFRHYFWATFLGAWPEAVFQVYLGHSFSNPKSLLIFGILLIFVFWLIYFFKSHPHFRALLNPFTQFKKLIKRSQGKKKKKLRGKRRKRF